MQPGFVADNSRDCNSGLIVQNVDAYVVKADGEQIMVFSMSGALDARLKQWGFTFDPGPSAYVKSVSEISEKAKIFSSLRDDGVAFSDGREWCPSELFEYFRGQNLLSGKFKRISWQDPQNFIVAEI